MASTAQKLTYLYPAGNPHPPKADWTITNDGKPGSLDVIFYFNEPKLGPQPTQAELDALTDQEVTSGLETQVARREKEQAIAGVDASTQKHARSEQRALLSVALSISEAINRTRATCDAINTAFQTSTTFPEAKTKLAAINYPPQVTPEQVLNAVKAAIAQTPE